MNFRYLVIEGNIGAGKTSFVKKLADKHNCKTVLEEFEENEFLRKFYKNPEKYAFPVEMSFLADRYNQLKYAPDTPDIFMNGIVADYHLSKSLIFASATLDKHEFKLFRDIFNIIWKKMQQPDLYVYLHKSVSQLLANIDARDRLYEKNISKDYLLNIERSYFDFFRQHPDLPVLVLNTDDIDFVNREEDFMNLEQKIFQKLQNS